MLERAIDSLKRYIKDGATRGTMEIEIMKTSTQDDVLNLIAKLPWFMLDRLRLKCWQLEHSCVEAGNHDGYRNLIDIEYGVIIPTKMIQILDDPNAPEDKKREAVKYAKTYGDEDLKAAFTPPGPNEKRATVIINTGSTYSDISLVVSKHVSSPKKG